MEEISVAPSSVRVRSRTEETSAAPSPHHAAFTKLRPRDVPTPKPVHRPVSAALGRAPSTDEDEDAAPPVQLQRRESAQIAAQPKFLYIVDYPLGEGADFEEVQRKRMSEICEEDEPSAEEEAVPAPSMCSSHRAAPEATRTPTPEWDLQYKALSMRSSCRAALQATRTPTPESDLQYKATSTCLSHCAAPQATRTPTPEWDLQFQALTTHSAHAAPALRTPTPKYDQPKIKCNECEAGFERRTLLRVHLEEVHAMYLCTTLYCEDHFVSQQACADHYAANHAHGQFWCEQCDKTFTHHSKYNEHMIVHTAEMDKKHYRCDWPDCDNVFSHERDL